MSLLAKIFNSRETILDMIKDRGFVTNSLDNYSFNEIELMFNTHPKNSKDISPLDISLSDENNNKLIVKYILTPRIRISNIQTIANNIIEDDTGNYDIKPNDTIILVVKDKITSEENLEEYFEKIYRTKKIFIQYFYVDTLTFNITKHNFVPKHEILTEKEKKELIETLNISSQSKLAKIKKTDPVAKYYGMKINDVCKIHRISETSGIYHYYRLCE